MKIVATKIDNEEFEKFNEKCLDKGCSKSETIRLLIREYSRQDSTQLIEKKPKDTPQVILIE